MFFRNKSRSGDDIREADFAGAWYPDTKKAVLKKIEEFVSDAKAPKEIGQTLVGGIVPHAGWVYSGKLACNVIKVLSEHSRPDTVVVLGTHMRPGDKPTILVKGEWWTPLGNLPVNKRLVKPLIEKFKFDEESPQHFDSDNTIELQMPFIKHYFPDVKVVTIGMPPTETSFEIGDFIVDEAANMEKDIAVIGSTDLTHYGPNYGMSPKGVGAEAVKWVKEVNDRSVIDLMGKMDHKAVLEDGLDKHNACCMGAASTAIYIGKLLGAKKAEVLDYYTSYDIDPHTSFVGYVGAVF